MASKLLPSLAASAFAAVLFHLFSKRRSREINGGEANDSVAANDGTAGGESGAHTSTEAPEMATSSSADEDATAYEGTAGGASSTHASAEGQGMDTSSGYDYEVFLSFAGSDTREGFTDFLYASLDDAGIRTFKDDKELPVGEEFGPKLLQAIEQSRISIPIFSKGYASSVWCLKELAKMVEIQKAGRQKIMPIFYDVAPSEVRYQTKGYAEAFLSHERKGRYGEETICQWKDALNAVGAINGWDLHSERKNRREGEFARKLTQKVSSELKKAYLAVSDCLVSVDDHVDAIMEMIGAQTSETRIIGIHGMGGIGKTTIAKMIYNKLSHGFQNCCVLRDIRETSKGNGIHCLQNQLISSILKTEYMDIKDIDEGKQKIKGKLSHKRVLLLLDDMEEENHIDALVGKRDWLGRGSKIIITTRNKNILDVPKVDCSYELTVMDLDRSLQLFSKHAFRRDFPLNEYIDQSQRAIGIAGGLPLALEVIGSLLCHTKKELWDARLKKLESVPHDKVQSKLEISYDALDFRQKRIFLDIACLFIGYDKDILVHFWDENDFFPEESMTVLQNVSLIKINEDNKVWMHDQLRDLGREIIRKKSDTKIEKQSRVWDPKEGLDLLRKHKGNKEVEALRLEFDHERQYRFTYEGFESLSNLRFLEVDGSTGNCAEERLLWHESSSNVLSTNENSDLLPQLRWLSWPRIPPTFKITNFSMEDIVVLNLFGSNITDDWKGWSHMKVMKNLKVLDLSHCSNLQRLPDKLGRDIARLEYLTLKWCSSLGRLSDSIRNLESLVELDISSTAIKELPDYIGKLKKLKKVKMEGFNITKIPDALWTIEKLQEIVSGCINQRGVHVNIGNCISGNKSLRILRLLGADIYTLPRLPESLKELVLSVLQMDTFPDLSNLTDLKELDLFFGSRDSDGKSDGLVEDPIPWWMGNLTKLESLALCFYRVTTPSQIDVSLPPQLKALHLQGSDLRRLPRLPSSLSSLRLSNCKSLCSMENLSNLKKLSSLHIEFAAITEIQGLGCLENLQDLELRELGQVKILPDLSNLNKLTSLQVWDCGNLVEIQGELPRCMVHFVIYRCGSLQKLPDLSSLMGKTRFQTDNYKILNTVGILALAWMEPPCLELVNFEQLQVIPDLSNFNELTTLHILKCGNLIGIQGGLPQSLEELKISSCKSIQKLPDLSSLKGLRKVVIEGCVKLNVDAILGSAQRSHANLWENLRYLRICGLGQVVKLPDLSNLNELRCLQVENCGNLVEIQGELPQSLEKLVIRSCRSIQKLPDLSNLKGLRKVKIKRCGKLKVEAISWLCSEKSVKFVGEDNDTESDYETEYESESELEFFASLCYAINN